MPTASELDARLARLSSEVDNWTRECFERFKPRSDRFAGVIGYPLGWVDADLKPLDSTAAAGKRLRPALCLLCCEAVGGDTSRAMPAAAAIELVHNFSLVHDDIQDESPLRRGRPTVWAVWKTAQAINVGDSLFAFAQLALAQAAEQSPELTAESLVRLNSTCLELVEGQFLDLELQANGKASLEAYQRMIAGKTAALLACSAWLGARFGGAQPQQADGFGRFGRQLGLAFQLQDDVLGLWGDPDLTGKSADTDLRTRKQALPAVLALESDGPRADRFRQLFLQPGEMSQSDAASARKLLEELGLREKAESMVEAAYAQAEAALDAALATGAPSLLRALLQRFRQRRA